MKSEDILNLAAELIRIKSLSGKEQEIINFLNNLFKSWGWQTELLEVEPNRNNLLVTFGKPEILFTTHVDVVPGKDFLFVPVIKDGRLTGRGACDTKGIIATMVATIKDLLSQGSNNFGLLLVVGEELDGSGAKAAAEQLAGRGVRYIINGEPTEGKLMRAHKGVLGLTIACRGKACHSGYPELGDDANVRLINILARLIDTKLPANKELGATTVNIGQIKGGVAGNVVSDRAEANVLFRTVTDNKEILKLLTEVVQEEGEYQITYTAPPVLLKIVDEIATDIASYCTDIPNFAPLKAEALLYGPGSIQLAHTDIESITAEDVQEARRGYELIFHRLQAEIEKR